MKASLLGGLVIAVLVGLLAVPATAGADSTEEGYVSPSTVDFGNVPENATTSGQSFTVTLGADYEFASFSLEMPFPGPFTASIGDCAGLTGPATCTLPVTFDPTAPGPVSENFTFQECEFGGAESCLDFNQVTATGSGFSTEEGYVSPSTVDFGNVPENATTSGQSFTVTLGADYEFASFSLEMPFPGPFTASIGDCAGLTGPATCTLPVTFDPTAPGPVSENFTFQECEFGGAESCLDFNQVTATGSGKFPQAITFTSNPSSPTYGDTYEATATRGASGNPIAYSSSTPSVCSATTSGVTSFMSAGTCTIDADQAGNVDYSAAPTEAQTFTVSPAPLLLTASSASVQYGSTAPTITPSYAGFVGSDNAASFTEAPSCKTSTTSSSNAGTYPTSCSGTIDSDYAFTYVGGTLSINKAPTTLVVAPVSVIRSLLSVSVIFSATLVVSGTIRAAPGQSVVFADGSEAGCSITTNVNGVARCSVSVLTLVALLLGPSYSATYGGGTNYLASRGNGTLTL